MNKRVVGLALFLLAGISGCKRPGESEAQVVVVGCYRDRNAPFEPWLTEVSHEFSSGQPKTRTGKSILITTYETNEFEKRLSEVGTRLHPNLVIVSSASQIPENSELFKELKNAKSVCPSRSPCLAFIPSWVQGDQRDAASRYVDFLLTHR